MSFHGKTEDPKPPRPLRKFAYRIYDGGIEHEIESHEIYFYDAGRVGFWNRDEDDEMVLVLATKAFQVRQVVAK
ncbi:hypothetical protein SEA_BAUER_84 [Arthrobacter phage Bauer]|uniref:Uncharacterized protein n=1 Tax=Arthrobacter phage Bauer TaxID=2985648 RepID=A0A9E7V2N7_9CAUD|nr:hypothetical protein QEO99_gp84 [Arthrobacter phage Bauer]UYM26633.1 hypothetical protein SEA_BAUER_84 [Arthrobacter phage Bauer]